MTASSQAIATVMLALISLGVQQAARADTVQAECAVVTNYGAPRDATSHCSFSQRQGYISIQSDAGLELNLAPDGTTPGNYTDQAGNLVYRRSGLGKKGLIFQTGAQFVYVYWSTYDLECETSEMTSNNGCSLTWAPLSFLVKASANGSINTLTLDVMGLETGTASFADTIDGTASRSEIADLDGNGWPEIYTAISSAGSGSYGSLVAYAVNAGKSLTPIYLPELDAEASQIEGYMGHDEFAVVENRLVRRYPIYRPGDTNSAPTGGTRQLQYRLEAGEAGWKLVVDRIAQY